MASLTFSATVMDDIRAAMRQNRQNVRAARAALTATPKIHHHGGHRIDDNVAMDDAEVYEASVLTGDQHVALLGGSAQSIFDSWVQDLDNQTLPEMDNDELRILHALLFGADDNAFAVADELLTQTLTARFEGTRTERPTGPEPCINK